VPARADTHDEPPSAELLEGGAHLREQRRVAEALAQDQVAVSQPRKSSRQVGQQGPALAATKISELKVIRDPDGAELLWQAFQDGPIVVHPIDAVGRTGETLQAKVGHLQDRASAAAGTRERMAKVRTQSP
jgi:hypothetical protein